MEFRPRPSFGWAWLLALAALLLGQPFVVLGQSSRNGLPVWLWLAEAGLFALGLWFVAIALLFPTMRYYVTADELVLRYGPMHWEVPLSEVRKVRRTDLGWTIWSSMRFPGFALFKVPYAGIGNVRMCATRSATGILLIETTAGRFGVTPADEDAFVEALRGTAEEKGSLDG